MSLRELEIQRWYRSDVDDLVHDFYVPCLSASCHYRRAAGYFTGSALTLVAEGLESFLGAGGRMQLVISPELRDLDYRDAAVGYKRRQERLEHTIAGSVTTLAQDETLREELGLLGWMIARRRLDIKIALVTSDHAPGIYHEKFGIFEDKLGDCVVFHGSANESRGGLRSNFESVIAFCSWREADAVDVDSFTDRFSRLWRDETPNLVTLDLPDAAREELVRLAQADGGSRTAPQWPPADVLQPAETEPSRGAVPRPPAWLELRGYQTEAISAWFSMRCVGILEMATGTGKTMTAMSAYARLFEALHEQGESLLAIVVCPYQHLVDQWGQAAQAFKMDPILCYRSRAGWASRLSSAIREVKERVTPTHLAIATNATFQSEHFQSLITDIPADSLFIADEAHNLGSPELRATLPQRCRFRLGLSATLDRHLDTEGTAAVAAYFSGVAYSFGLREAIAAGALTPYDYAVTTVELEGEELDRYLDLTRRIGRAIGVDGVEGPAAQALMIARARLLANARGKLPALAEAIAPHSRDSHMLVYCGDGSQAGDTGEAGKRQIESVVSLLGRDLGMRVQPYTAETEPGKRAEIAERFGAGDLQALVAIRCLDEGFDVPQTEKAFILASSTNPRQYIQRRGRVLRQSPATGKVRALIHDFLAIPPRDALDASSWATERRLVARELTRVIAFARLAANGPVAIDSLGDLRERYDLLHL